jgi:hypothetical protein
MVTVFVRNENGVQSLRTNSDRLKALGNLARAKSGIDQKPALAGGD